MSVRLMDLQLEARMAEKKVQLLAHLTEKQWVKLKESCLEKSLVNLMEVLLERSLVLLTDSGLVAQRESDWV